MPILIKPSGRYVASEELIKQNKDVLPSSKPIPTTNSPNPPQTEEETYEEKKSKRFYLPVLRINDPTQWESKPLSERVKFTPDVAKKTCLGNCCGVKDLKAGCCQLDPDDIEHVLGPVDEDWIRRTIKWFRNKNINVTRADLVIDYEEGKLIGEAHFHGHAVFKEPASYPILRIQASGIRFACKFLNVENGMCTIYEQRPDMCRNYLCEYVKKSFLVNSKTHPNTYKKIG